MKISDHDMEQLVEVFAPVLEWLDVEVYKKNPKVSFNMTMYHDKNYALDYLGQECNESVCVLGYIWKHNGFDDDRDHGTAIIEDTIEKFEFDDESMIRNVLNRISMVENKNGESLVDDLNVVQPYQVAAVIRHFLKTGKIKWKKFLTEEQKKNFTEDDGIFYV